METSNGYSTNYQYSSPFAASRRDVTYRIDVLMCPAWYHIGLEMRPNKDEEIWTRGPHIVRKPAACGSCGYDLNLNSSSRNTSTIGSKYGKSIKKGIISFFSIDESRFNQVKEFSCVPYFISKHSWGFFRRRTKLMCRNCGNLIGIARDVNDASAYHLITNGLNSPSANEISSKRKYDIRIRSLQPSSAGFGTPLVL